MGLRTDFLRRYHNHFKTNADPESRPVFTVWSSWFNDEAKSLFPTLNLSEQYDFVYEAVRMEMFESAKNVYVGGNKDKPVYYDGDNPNDPNLNIITLKN